MGARVTHQLPLIASFVAELNKFQVTKLIDAGYAVFPNKSVKSDGWAIGQRIGYTRASATRMSNAASLHDSGIYGSGVTIVVLDSGVKTMTGIRQDVYGNHRVYGTYDAVNNKTSMNDGEESGHGTHVASIALNSERDIDGEYYGIAPGARLISVKAFDADGQSTYADVIRGIEWSIYYRQAYNIRVLNLSFSSEPLSYYWQDPINQAVMKAWQAGIVVVTSAGNGGVTPMGIGVPGNLPYVITVGATTDNYTPDDDTDDRLASFSASGPTFEGFVKPDLVAPGGHLMGLMESKMRLASLYPEFHDGGKYFTMSGTSQSSAVVSGVVALMLSADPSLTPDEVKCRLLDSARPARNNDGSWRGHDRRLRSRSQFRKQLR